MSMDINTPINSAQGGVVVQGLRKVYGQGDTAVDEEVHALRSHDDPFLSRSVVIVGNF